MTIWKNTDGAVVRLKPSRLLHMPSTGHRHAFGVVAGSLWPEYRISSAVIAEGTEDGVPWVRTRSRQYIVDGQDQFLATADAIAQLSEFLAAWRVDAAEWPKLFAQLG